MGSTSEYCSAMPGEDHHLVSHSVNAGMLRWIPICTFCGWIDQGDLRKQLAPPTPVRTFESHGVEDQTSDKWNDNKSCLRPGNEALGPNAKHHMISIKTGSPKVPYVEQCSDCSWIDPRSLQWWADNAVKESLSARAVRIAAATETNPFAFVQSSDEELELIEIVFQALGAASVAWSQRALLDAGEFNGTFAKSVGDALIRELERFRRIEREDAAKRLRGWMRNHFSDGTITEAARIVEQPGSAAASRPGVKEWSDLAYELYGLACNVSEGQLDATQTAEWMGAFTRLQKQFHDMQPGAVE